MTWDAYHRRGEVLRTIVAEADRRRDGVLPMDLPGVAEAFGDELTLVAALQLRWHTRLAGRIERALAEQPADPEPAVLSAWRATATELAGIRRILDACAERPSSEEMATALERARAKEWSLLAAMAGRGAAPDPAALRAGRTLEEQARSGHDPAHRGPKHRGPHLAA
jgi:hypothetical protein